MAKEKITVKQFDDRANSGGTKWRNVKNEMNRSKVKSNIEKMKINTTDVQEELNDVI